MRRKGGGDKLFKKNKSQKEKLKRIEKKRTERVRVLIACEGEKTEPYYFESLIEDKKLSAGSVVFVSHNHTNPHGVLTDLLDYLKNKDSDFEHKWIVIDRDEHGHTLEDFNNALHNAKKRKIGIAYSNPSFEFWYLIHFGFFHSSIHRSQVLKLLKSTHIQGYEKKADDIYHILLPKQNDAIRNAKKLLEYHKDTDKINPARNNPSTTVHELVELLNSFKQ